MTTTTSPITLTAFDRDRLEDLLDDDELRDGIEPLRFAALEAELQRAHVVEPSAIPRDVVTMNTRVELVDIGSGERQDMTVVFPADADPTRGRVSVLAPVGLALLGVRVGEVLQWLTPGASRSLRVEAIAYQPEASGDFDR